MLMATSDMEENDLSKDCFEITKLLIQLGADTESINNDLHTPLCVAALRGNMSAAEALLLSGALVDPFPNTGETPLSLAAKQSHVSLAKMLLKAGANVKMLLLTAVDTCDYDAIQKYADCGIDFSINMGDISLLHYSVSKNRTKMVKLLLNLGAPVNQKTGLLNETALHIAAEEGELTIVKILLRYGTDINAKDVRGWTPLRYAHMNGNPSVIQTLEKFLMMEAEWLDIVEDFNY